MSRQVKYPWEKWMDGNTHTATYQEDFNCSLPSFIAGLHQKARNNEFTVTTSTDGLQVSFQFAPKPEDAN